MKLINGIDKTDRDILTYFHGSRILTNSMRPEEFIKLVKQYGKYDFFHDYKKWLESMYVNTEDQYEYFSTAVISYLRIINR